MRTKSSATLTASLALCALGALATAAVAGTPPAGDPACRPLLAAAARQIDTPNHLFMTRTAASDGGKEKRSETISVGGVMYMRVAGKWSSTKLTPRDLHAMQDGPYASACKYLRDEVVDGEAAAVYSTHSNTDGNPVDGTVWISKAKGLPLRQEIDMNVGGKLGKSHISTRYVYANVQPPPM
jgi:hypothetical protein